jgi:CheY-like chemotaxis protein
MMPETADCLVIAVTADPDLTRMLRRLDCVVEVIPDNRDALRRLREAAPALLFLDLEAADFDVLAYIRQQSRLAATRVIVIAADVVCPYGLGTRVEGELLKPVRPEDLARLVARLPFATDSQSGPG